MKAGRDGGGRSESRVEVGRSRAVAVEGASDRDGDRATVNERGVVGSSAAGAVRRSECAADWMGHADTAPGTSRGADEGTSVK